MDTVTSHAGTDIVLDVHICDQRRSYVATFANEQQALDFIASRSSTHAFHEIATPADIRAWERLYALLYPTCEHGLSADLCGGPMHWYD